MKKIILSSLTLFALAAVFAFSTLQNWKIKDTYSIKFSGKGVDGIFKTFKGTMSFDEANLATSKFDVTIDVSSINTGNGLQNKHALSDDWFDAQKYPNIRFTSSSMEKTSSGYKANGTMEVHGVKKDFSVPFTFKKSGSGGTFTANFTVNRLDFKVGKASNDVSDNIKLNVSIPVTKK